MLTKVRNSSHFTVKSSLTYLWLLKKGEVQMHHLVFNEMQVLSIVFTRKFDKSKENSRNFPVSHSQQNLHFMEVLGDI